MTSPAQVMNDMAAQSRVWDRRDKRIAYACRDAGILIAKFLSGEHVDGRTYSGVWGRLLDLGHTARHRGLDVSHNIDRARFMLERLKAEARS